MPARCMAGASEAAPGDRHGQHIMAVMPPTAKTALEDFQPVVQASEGAWVAPAWWIVRRRNARSVNYRATPRLAEACFYRDTQHSSHKAGAAATAPEVEIVQDAELGREVVELVGAQVELRIAVKCPLPYLVLHVKDVDRFTGLTLTLVDTTKRIRRYSASNKQTVIRAKGDAASAPLLLVPGWNLVVLDLPSIMQQAFGAEFAYCKEVCLQSTMRVARVFFQDALYEDEELPPFLRVLP